MVEYFLAKENVAGSNPVVRLGKNSLKTNVVYKPEFVCKFIILIINFISCY